MYTAQRSGSPSLSIMFPPQISDLVTIDRSGLECACEVEDVYISVLLILALITSVFGKFVKGVHVVKHRHLAQAKSRL